MPIQYHCPSCGQPIEVDDDAANQPVTCPYCRRMSSAPAATPPDFDPRTQTPAGGSARPVASPGPPAFPGSRGAPPAPPIPAGNTLGFIALSCVLVAAVMMIPASKMGVPIQESVQSIQDPVQRQNALSAEVLKHPALIILTVLSSCVLPLTAVVLAVISLVRKRVPRWPAFTALGLVCGGILMMCLGFIGQVLGGGV